MAWFGVAFLSLVAGFSAVRYLIAPPAVMTGYAALALLCLFLSAVLLLRLKKASLLSSPVKTPIGLIFKKSRAM